MWEQQQKNKRNTWIMVLGLTFMMMGGGYTLGELQFAGQGWLGLMMGMLIAIGYFLISYFAGDHVILGMMGAVEVTDKSVHQTLYNVTEEMSIAAGMGQMPRIFIMDDPSLNAFAVGRNPENASIAVTRGLLNELNRSELQGVVGHEMAHIINRDILLMMVTLGILTSIECMGQWMTRSHSRWGHHARSSHSSRRGNGSQLEVILLVVGVLMVILAPLIGRLLFFAISRQREYLADACSVQFTRYPEGLANALEKIGHRPHVAKGNTPLMAPFFIASPLQKSVDIFSQWSSTHPPLQSRIHILKEIGHLGTSDNMIATYQSAYEQVVGQAAQFMAPLEGAPFLSARLSVPTPPPPTHPDDEMSHRIQRTRETTQTFWNANGYYTLECPCSTRLRVPPYYFGNALPCPQCGSTHHIPPAQSA